MKPITLCLIQMGQKGLELVKSYPEALPKEILNQIVIKSMPFNAREGDFSSNTVEDTVFSGYIFAIPSKVGRNNIASLVAVFDNMKYNTDNIRRVFSFTINELKKNNLADVETITKILPNLYNGLTEGQLKIKISSIVTLEFDFDKTKDKDQDQDALNGFGKDLWK